MRDTAIRLADGRTLAFLDIGDPGWTPVVFCHGAPMSRLHLAYLDAACARERIRAVAVDRPGYGGSSPQPGRTLDDWPADVAALADALALHRFVAAGHSSGGPYALCCAARLGERVAGVLVMGGVTDFGWPGAWEGYVESERQLMQLPGEEAAVRWCVERFGADGQGFMTASDFDFGDADNRLLADGLAGPAVQAAIIEAFRQGVIGYAQDMIVQGRPWPFDPATVTAPVHVLHGELDVLLPAAHSRHTAAIVRGAILRVLPGHGHLTPVSELPALASALARSAA